MCLEGAAHAYWFRSRFATPESLREIHRVLRQGAVLGMIWNIEDCKSTSYTGRHLLLCLTAPQRQQTEQLGGDNQMGAEAQ